MNLFVCLDIEAPTSDEEGNPVRTLVEHRKALVKLGFKVQVNLGQAEHGCWDNDAIKARRLQMRAVISERKLDKVAEMFELEADDSENGGMMGGPYGFSSGPCITFNGACRYDENRREVSDLIVAGASVVPQPPRNFDRLSKKQQADAWESLERRVIERWGSMNARARLG